MKKTMTLTYPAQPADVAAMLADPDYQRQRLGRLLQKIENKGVEVTVVGQATGTFTATLGGTVPASALPAAAKRLVRSDIEASLAETWLAPAADGSRSGTITLTATAVPVTLDARTAMKPGTAQDTTTMTIDLDLTVKVPLLGRTLEEHAMGYVDRLLDDERERASAWLAQR